MYYITVLIVIAQLIRNIKAKEENGVKKFMKMTLTLGAVAVIFFIVKSKNK